MTRREYDQACSLAGALDRVGERWSLLIARELSLGPLRFSDLARSVGGAPTDVLTKRLRDLERDGVVARRELEPPASATVYELTEIGRGLERTVIELGRWGTNFQTVEEISELEATSLPNAVRVALRPPTDSELTLGLRSRGQSYRLAIAGGWIEASRGDPAAAPACDVTLSGEPLAVLAALVAGEAGEDGVEVEGDRAALERLRSMVDLPERLREEALATVAPPTPAT